MHDDAITKLRGMYAVPPRARHCKKKRATPHENRIEFILLSHVASLLREHRARSPRMATPQIHRRRGEELRHERCVVLATSETQTSAALPYYALGFAIGTSAARRHHACATGLISVKGPTMVIEGIRAKSVDVVGLLVRRRPEIDLLDVADAIDGPGHLQERDHPVLLSAHADVTAERAYWLGLPV